ncbi:unnamed protein product [Linum tenue]|uniref:Uncharacterized protein n=1 Tax=Linum tenue TaxID=586396 RepID=A0AAV0IR59_9ROSI|nr:unnamed protein product [Linum tenue]
MLVVVGIFAILILLFFVVIPCLKRAAARSAGDHSSGELFSQSSPRGRQLAAADKRDE